MGDFWSMAYENNCPLIMMVTVIAERGRVKCHKYWPDVGETMEYENQLAVTGLDEVQQGSMAIRRFSLTKPVS